MWVWILYTVIVRKCLQNLWPLFNMNAITLRPEPGLLWPCERPPKGSWEHGPSPVQVAEFRACTSFCKTYDDKQKNNIVFLQSETSKIPNHPPLKISLFWKQKLCEARSPSGVLPTWQPSYEWADLQIYNLHGRHPTSDLQIHESHWYREIVMNPRHQATSTWSRYHQCWGLPSRYALVSW